MEKQYLDKNYKPEIDGLRGFAVIAVILNHTSSKILQSGFLGVDIFFVISGFVLTLSLQDKKYENFFEFFTSFFYRRIKRLLPALIIFCITTAIFITLFNPLPQTGHMTGITGLLGYSNIYLLKQSADYFTKEALLNPFTHTWSLDVEEQFYLLFPFFIWFSGFGRQKHSGEKILLNLMLFFSTLSFLTYVYLNINFPISSYFLMPSRFWEMGFGCILFILYKKNNNLIQKISSFPPLLILFSIFVVMLTPKSNNLFSTPTVVFLTSLLILSVKENTKIYKLFTNKFLNHIGLLSYSLYLWHWAVLSISAWTIGIHIWTIPLQYALMYFLAFLSYKYVEQPFRKGNLFSKKWKLFFSSFLTLFGAVTFIASLSLYFKDYLFLGNKTLVNNYSEKVLWSYEKCSTSPKENKVPDYKLFNNCWFKSSDKDSKISPRKQVFFYGSSYNQQLMSIPAELVKTRKDLRFNSFVTYSCIAAKYINLKSKNVESCNKIFNKYLDFFQNSSNEGDQLVIANSYINFKNKRSLLKKYLKEIEDLHKYLQRNKRQLIIVTPIPLIQSNPTVCTNWYAKYNNYCYGKKIFNYEENNYLKSIKQDLLSLENKGIKVINIYSLLENKLNYNGTENYALYYDKNHLSKKGANLFINEFEKLFNK